MGDLNVREDSEEYLELIGSNDPNGFQLHDSYRSLFPQIGDEASFHKWTGNRNNSRFYGWKIDFVLFTEYFMAGNATIERAKVYDRYPSDHFPVAATLTERR